MVCNYIRYSEYMTMEKIEQHITRLRQCYEVYYYEGTFNLKTQMLVVSYMMTPLL